MPALNAECRYVGLAPRPGAVAGVKTSSIDGVEPVPDSSV